MNKQDAITFFGSKSKLAEAIGVTKQAVGQWVDIPEPRQYQIQVISNGALLADRRSAA